MRKKLIVGNWKMHGSHPANAELLAGIVAARPFMVDVAVCVPFPYIAETAVALAAHDIRWGAQDCSSHERGAYTGEVSAAMLAEFGCRYAIVGHSERRLLFGEDGPLLSRKLARCREAGLTPIYCIGETAQQRDAGQTLAVLGAQIATLDGDPRTSPLVVAYEPVWAIGTSRSATPADIFEGRAHVAELLQGRADVRILYGGSVTAETAAALMAGSGVDGFLIGGASLSADSFAAIARA